MRAGKICYNASVTVETALVMPLVILLIFSFIKFGFELHDRTIGGMLNKYEVIKGRMIDWSYYNVESHKIDTIAIVNKPLLELGGTYRFCQRALLNQYISSYERELCLAHKGEEDTIEYSSGFKSSTLIRTTHILLEHMENIEYD